MTPANLGEESENLPELKAGDEASEGSSDLVQDLKVADLLPLTTCVKRNSRRVTFQAKLARAMEDKERAMVTAYPKHGTGVRFGFGLRSWSGEDGGVCGVCTLEGVWTTHAQRRLTLWHAFRWSWTQREKTTR